MTAAASQSARHRQSWTAVLLAAHLVVAACGHNNSIDTPSIQTSPPRTGTASCDVSVQEAQRFLNSHAAGPSGLSEPERDELKRVLASVEEACPPNVVAAFGPEELEPWSLQSHSSEP